LSPLKFSRKYVEKLVQNHQLKSLLPEQLPKQDPQPRFLLSCLSTVNILTTLGIYDGETPHSFRAGCAITMALADSVENVEGVMNHIGWFSQESDRKHSSRFYYCFSRSRAQYLYLHLSRYCRCSLFTASKS
jgi:hypothetical protein